MLFNKSWNSSQVPFSKAYLLPLGLLFRHICTVNETEELKNCKASHVTTNWYAVAHISHPHVPTTNTEGQQKLRFRVVRMNIKNMLLKVKYHYLLIKYLLVHLVRRWYNHARRVQGKILFEDLGEQSIFQINKCMNEIYKELQN